MSRGQPTKGNPFLEDDDVDDFTFLSHPQQGSSGYMLDNGSRAPSHNDYNQKRQLLLEQRRQIEERTLQSSKASLGLMYESEKVGIATAEELTRQGEKLQNIGSNVDSMNAIMRTTQKNLTSMKSFFGGMKNLFGKPDPDPTSLPNSKSTPGLNTPSYNSNLGNTVAQISKESTAKASGNATTRSSGGLDTTGFKFDDEDNGGPKNRRASEMSQKDRSRQIDKQLDNNLDELGLGLGRLKQLALGLGDEIENQNEMIEGITSRSERADDTLRHQNRQMTQLLKK